MAQQFDANPVVARWELRSVAIMLISAHGSDAESVAERNLRQATADGHEGNEIVWEGIITQLKEIRAEQPSQ